MTPEQFNELGNLKDETGFLLGLWDKCQSRIVDFVARVRETEKVLPADQRTPIDNLSSLLEPPEAKSEFVSASKDRKVFMIWNLAEKQWWVGGGRGFSPCLLNAALYSLNDVKPFMNLTESPDDLVVLDPRRLSL